MKTLSTTQLLQLMEDATVRYNDNEQETFSIGYLRNLLNKFTHAEQPLDEEISMQLEKIIKELPNKNTIGEWDERAPKFKEIALLKDVIRKRYNYVPKGHYKRVFLPLGVAFGMPLGLPIGAAMGNIALGLPLGIPFGIPLGLAIGTRLDRIAEREERVL
jgi:hypothetical protein